MSYYCVYIAECSDGTYYIGYTKNIERRIKEHNTSKKGAKYTSGRRPIILKYYETYKTISEALKREYQLKNLSRNEKQTLISTE